MPRKQNQSTFPRLETQIHRRKKAKAFSPLLPEWEKQDGTPQSTSERIRHSCVRRLFGLGTSDRTSGSCAGRSFVRLLSRQPPV
jgi:hypothetical protein